MNLTAVVLTIAVAAALCWTARSGAAEEKPAAPRTWLVGDYSARQICFYREGQGVVWTHKVSGVYDCWARRDGNVVWADYSGVHEITPDLDKREGGKVLWNYAVGSAAPKFAGKAEVHSCQPQLDETVVTAEAGSLRLITLDRSGAVTRTLALPPSALPIHNQLRLTRRGPDGVQWIAYSGEGLAREIAADGQVRRTLSAPNADKSKAPFRLYEALPLANGHVLLGTAALGSVVQYDAEGKVVWEFTNADAKPAGFTMKWIAGVLRLRNGNTVICDWQGLTHKAFEVTPDKKVVWRLEDPAFKGLSRLQLVNPWE